MAKEACVHCGSENDPELTAWRFCVKCGKRLSSSRPVIDEAAAAPRVIGDVGQESAAALESSAASDRTSWILQRLGYLALGLLCVAIAIGIMIWAPVGHSRGPAYGAGSFLLLGLTVAGYQVFKLAKGLPKAGRSPAKTLKQFFSHCLVSGGGSVGLEAYVCLLTTAKRAAGSFNDFKAYWSDVQQRMETDLRQRDFAASDVNHFFFLIEDIREVASETMATYSVRLKVVAFSGQGSMVSPAKMLGCVYFRTTCNLAQVGQRWYLTDHRWLGKRELKV